MSIISSIVVSDAVKKVLEEKCSDLFLETYNIAKNEWEKCKVDLDIAFSKYEENAMEKYSKVKTLLYRSEPQPLMEFFEIPFISAPHREYIKVNQVGELLDISNFLILKGTGGIGKSTLLKYLLLKEIEEAELIPIFIELKDLNNIDSDFDLVNVVLEKMKSLGCTLERKGYEYALDQGCFLFLLDGYDELNSNKQQLFVKALNCFCDKYKNNYYILSSRPLSDFVEFDRFTVLTSKRLDKTQAVSLIGKLKFDQNIKEKFIDDLKKNLYKRHKSFASNPLLLNMMLLTYDNYAEIPEKLHVFYSQAFETLYSKHDATKAGFKREIQCGLPYDNFVKVFSTFCFITYIHNKYRFSLEEINDYLALSVKQSDIEFDILSFREDLINYLCVIYKDGNDYIFTHRSFQEYFTAFFLKELDDNLMTKIALSLIEKDSNRASNDETFKMLYDMTGDRFEKNIIIPLLDDIESENQNQSLYDFYFQKIVNGISVECIDFDGDYDDDDIEDFEEIFGEFDMKDDPIINQRLDIKFDNSNEMEGVVGDKKLDDIESVIFKDFEDEYAESMADYITKCIEAKAEDIKLIMIPDFSDGKINFIEKICINIEKQKYKTDYADNNVIEFLYKQVTQNNRSYELSYQQIKENNDLYMLLKESWIGMRCSQLAELHKRLTEKKTTSQHSLLELLR